MKIEINIDESCKEAKLVLTTDRMTEQLNDVIKRISGDSLRLLSGFKEDVLEMIEQEDVIRIYANSGKVFAETNQEKYLLKLRIYELEERLDSDLFVRISNSELINLKQVKAFDLSIVGTICVKMKNNSVTYASRRYVSKIKKKLGI